MRAGRMAEKRGPSGGKTRLKPSQLAGRALVPALQAWSSLGIRFSLQRANGGVDAAARIHSSIAGPVMMRNTLPPLASNDLLGGVRRLCEVTANSLDRGRQRIREI